jgi:UDPglucose 6-dehydrogenase
VLHTGRLAGVPLSEIASARATNDAQPARIAAALRRVMPTPMDRARIAALGLTFKAGTSDVRDSPALAVCAALGGAGARVTGYDPQLKLIDRDRLLRSSVAPAEDPYLAARGADAIVVLTEWPEFRELDWPLIAHQAPLAVVVDTRNVLDVKMIADAGLTYLGNGTPSGF